MLTVWWCIEIQTPFHDRIFFIDSSSAWGLEMDSPSETHLKSQLRAYDQHINKLKNDFQYKEIKRKMEDSRFSIQPYQKEFYNRVNAAIISIKQEIFDLEVFKKDHKHHLGHISCASGADRDIPSKTWGDGSPTTMDWALIDAPGQCKTNKVSSFLGILTSSFKANLS